MPGRTERVNAKDLLERADNIIFEGDVVRSWVEQLAKRAQGALDAGKGNRYFEAEWKPEFKELENALQALERACESLTVFEAAAKRRGA